MGMLRRGLFRVACALLLTFAALSPAAADFKLTDSDGKAHWLADYRGKWVIVNFWATWCAPCLEEIPDLVAIMESRKDVQVLGVAMEFQIETGLQCAEGMFLKYPIDSLPKTAERWARSGFRLHLFSTRRYCGSPVARHAQTIERSRSQNRKPNSYGVTEALAAFAYETVAWRLCDPALYATCGPACNTAFDSAISKQRLAPSAREVSPRSF